MNPMFDQVFNQQAMNQDYIQQIRINQYHAEQRQEIAKAVNAIHEYFSAARKIAPEYQQAAAWECLCVVADELNQK